MLHSSQKYCAQRNLTSFYSRSYSNFPVKEKLLTTEKFQIRSATFSNKQYDIIILYSSKTLSTQNDKIELTECLELIFLSTKIYINSFPIYIQAFDKFIIHFGILNFLLLSLIKHFQQTKQFLAFWAHNCFLYIFVIVFFLRYTWKSNIIM